VTGIARMGVVGCGLMGSGAAEIAARAGLDVRVAVTSDASAAAGRQRIVRSLDRAVRAGKLDAADRDAALARITITSDLTELADRQLVLECIIEDEPAKLEVFGALDKIVEDGQAILASNTSAIPIVRLARATARPGSVVGLHFFSPVPALPLVELIGSVLTEESTCARAEEFVTTVLGKQVIRSPDRAGFVVNALLLPYLLGAVRMVESGFADAEVIDRAMMLGCSHPVGPLRLADLVGLDVVASVGKALYEEFKEPLYAPPPLLSRMVDGGLLGRKTGRGFYRYE
jgi:3-hydroxybutyryl-CoA dehydrogenase